MTERKEGRKKGEREEGKKEEGKKEWKVPPQNKKGGKKKGN